MTAINLIDIPLLNNLTKLSCNSNKLTVLPLFEITYLDCSFSKMYWIYKWSNNEHICVFLQTYYRLKRRNKIIGKIKKSDFINIVYEKNIANIVANYII